MNSRLLIRLKEVLSDDFLTARRKVRKANEELERLKATRAEMGLCFEASQFKTRWEIKHRAAKEDLDHVCNLIQVALEIETKESEDALYARHTASLTNLVRTPIVRDLCPCGDAVSHAFTEDCMPF